MIGIVQSIIRNDGFICFVLILGLILANVVLSNE